MVCAERVDGATRSSLVVINHLSETMKHEDPVVGRPVKAAMRRRVGLPGSSRRFAAQRVRAVEPVHRMGMFLMHFVPAGRARMLVLPQGSSALRAGPGPEVTHLGVYRTRADRGLLPHDTSIGVIFGEKRARTETSHRHGCRSNECGDPCPLTHVGYPYAAQGRIPGMFSRIR